MRLDVRHEDVELPDLPSESESESESESDSRRRKKDKKKERKKKKEKRRKKSDKEKMLEKDLLLIKSKHDQRPSSAAWSKDRCVSCLLWFYYS